LWCSIPNEHRAEIDMALVELRGANEGGEETGVLFANADQIVAISSGPNATEVQMAEGRTRWV
jgi:hypothetical protein